MEQCEHLLGLQVCPTQHPQSIQIQHASSCKRCTPGHLPLQHVWTGHCIELHAQPIIIKACSHRRRDRMAPQKNNTVRPPAFVAAHCSSWSGIAVSVSLEPHRQSTVPSDIQVGLVLKL